MVLGAAAFTELVTSTLEAIDKDTLYDNVFTRHPLLDLLNAEVKSETGRALVVNLELAEDTSTQWTDDSGTFATAVSGEIIGAATYQWSSPLVSSVRVKWKTLKMNSGKQQIINLLKTHISNMQKAHAKTIVTALHYRYNAGLPDSGVIDGLDGIVSNAAYDADPMGAGGAEGPIVIGGINSATQPLWVATRREAPIDGTLDIRQSFRRTANDIYENTSGNNAPDHVVCGRDVFEEFEDSFDDKIRYIEFGEGQSQFTAVKFGDLEVRLDPDCPSRRAYLLDKSSWVMRSLAGTFMETQESQTIQGTLDRVTPVASVLAVGVNERRANGVLLRPTTAGGDA